MAMLEEAKTLRPAAAAQALAVALRGKDAKKALLLVSQVPTPGPVLDHLSKLPGVVLGEATRDFCECFLLSENRPAREAAARLFSGLSGDPQLFRRAMEALPALAGRQGVEFFAAMRAIATEEDATGAIPALLGGPAPDAAIAFLLDVLGPKLFERVPIARLFAPKLSLGMIGKLLRVIPTDAHFVGTPECASLLRHGFSGDMSIFVLRVCEGPGAKSLLAQLWSEDTIRAHLQRSSLPFFQASWRVLKRYQDTASVFFDKKAHELIWRHAQRSPIAQPLFRVLAEFNPAFARIKGEERGIFGLGATKRRKLFEFYLKAPASLDKWMEIGKGKATAGRTGVFRFIWSLVELDDGWVTTLAAHFFSAHHRWIDGKHGGEHGIAKLLAQTAQLVPSHNAVAIFARELGTMPASASSAVNILCGALLKMALSIPGVWPTVRTAIRDRLANTVRVEVFGANTRAVVEAALDRAEAESVLKAARAAVVQEIKAGKTVAPEKLGDTVSRIKSAIAFIDGVADHFGIEKVGLNTIARDVRSFVARIQDQDPANAAEIVEFSNLQPSP
jgi:hypothetical protein